MHGLAAKVALWFSVLMVAVIGATTLFSFQQSRMLTVESKLDFLAFEVQEKISQFNDEIAQTKNDVLFLAGSPDVQAIVRELAIGGTPGPQDPTGDGPRERLKQLFTEFLQRHPHYSQIRFLGGRNTGMEQVRVDRRASGTIEPTPPEALQDKSRRPYVAQTLRRAPGEVALSRIDLNREHGKVSMPPQPTIRLSTPLYHRGTPFGLVIINLDLRTLLRAFTEAYPWNVEVSLTDADGALLAYRDPSKTFGKDLHTGYSLATESPKSWSLLQGISRNPEDSTNAATLERGDRCLYVTWFRAGRVPDGPLVGTLAEVSTSQILHGLAVIKLQTALFALLAMGLGTLLVWLLSRQAILPVSQLTFSLRAFGQGLPVQSLPLDRADEVGDLARAFQAMREQITERTQSLKTQDTQRKRAERELSLLATAFNTREAIAITDEQSRIIRVNEAFTKITGYSGEEVIGNRPSLLKSGRHDADFYAQMWRAINEDGQWDGEIWNRRKNGEIFPEWLSISCVYGDDGKLTNHVAHFTDLSVVKAQQEKIARIANEETVLGMLLRQSLTDSSLEDFLASSLRILLSEVAWLKLMPKGAIFRYQEDSGTGHLDMIVEHNLNEQTRQACAQIAMGECLCGKAAQSGEIIYASEADPSHELRFDGMEEHTHYVIPLFHGDELFGVLTLYLERDHQQSESEMNFLLQVTTVLSLGIHKRFAEDALIAAKNDAEQANRAKSEFLSCMSHELRTPLNAIIGFSQLLGIEDLGGDATECVHEIQKAGDHLLGLINDVLDLAKIEARRVELSMEPIGLKSLLEQCRSLVLPLASQYDVQLGVREVDPEIAVHADRTRLKQVLVNLLSNAAKYNRRGGSATLFVEPDHGSMVRIIVDDTGHGLSEKALALLFEPFNRLGAEQSDVEGTGIGLVISKTLVELMGGSIGVQSTLGKGSRFWIDLPATTEVPSPAAEGDGHVPEDASPRAGAVLYIEDNSANVQLVRKALEPMTHVTLLTANEPLHGLSLAKDRHPDLILLDINLPGLDGYAVLQQLEISPATRDIPVVAVTASAMRDDIEKGRSAGFREYLTKPIDVRRLRNLVAEYLAARVSPPG